MTSDMDGPSRPVSADRCQRMGGPTCEVCFALGTLHRAAQCAVNAELAKREEDVAGPAHCELHLMKRFNHQAEEQSTKKINQSGPTLSLVEGGAWSPSKRDLLQLRADLLARLTMLSDADLVEATKLLGPLLARG